MTEEPAALDEAALLAEATKRAGMVWVGPAEGEDQPRAVWFVWEDGAAYVLCGPGEQPQPVPVGTRARVVVPSKDKQTRLVSFDADAEEVPPGEEWDRIAAAMVPVRLNLPDGEAAVARWAGDCRILRLRPDGGLVEAPGRYDSASHAGPPVATTAGTRVPRPWHLFGRQGRSRRRA